MKYIHKCPSCNREATTKYRGVYFCNSCAKYHRKNKTKVVAKEVLLVSLEHGGGIYGYTSVKLH